YALSATMEESEPKPIAFDGHEAAMVAGLEGGTTTTHVTLATRAAGPLQDLTERRPGLAIDAYPLGRLLLLRCVGDADGIERTPELRDSGRKVLYHTRSEEEETLLLDGGTDEADVIASLEEQHAHIVPPIRWRRGEALISLVLEAGADPRALLDQFPDARLVSKRRPAGRQGARGALSSPLFLPKLTEKQARALLAAFQAGYYEFPRNVTTEDVSLSLGIARSTFEQHLNRAEHHVIGAMLPLVRMRSGRPHGEALEVYSKFSRELGLYVQLEVLGDRVASVRFARDAPRKGGGSEHPYLARILEHVRTGKGDLRDIPLHLEVGPFEREVLEFLRTIPRGRTITYGEIAQKLGRPGASRSVGTACARNPAVVVIPCHRVVPKSGGLGNYSSEGGTETKRKLLEREGARLPDGSAPGRRDVARQTAKRSARPRQT
ncbi:MAG: methylated-DNA--[protein]-cysteine S-methyltransferase, partial [Thermoplasmata archaeon]